MATCRTIMKIDNLKISQVIHDKKMMALALKFMINFNIEEDFIEYI